MDDNFKDYFNEVERPDPPRQESPEEREQREISEDTIERGINRRRMTALAILAVVLIALTVLCRYFFFSPFRVDSQVTGYIMEMNNEGDLFKTYECKMVSKEFIVDTLHTISTDFNFSIRDDSLARKAVSLKGTGHRVQVTYDEYHGWLPWRGETCRFASAIEVRDSL